VSAVISDTTANALLDSAVTNSISQGTPFLALHTGFPPTYNPGNEVTGGAPAYARQACAFDAAASRIKSLTGTELFDIPAGTTVRCISLCNTASGASTLRAWSPAGASARRAIGVVAADLAGNTIQSPAHGLVAGNSVLFWATVGAALPTGLSEDTEYFVIAAGLTTDVFEVSTTLGGAAVDITAIGDGDVQKFTPEVFAGQGQYTVSDFDVSLVAG
jgi:hypothetical protein